MQRVFVPIVDEIDDCAMNGIGGHADNADRLVQHDVESPLCRLNDITIKLDATEAIDFAMAVRLCGTIYFDSPGRDQPMSIFAAPVLMFGDETDEFDAADDGKDVAGCKRGA